MAAEAAHILKKKSSLLSLEKYLDKRVTVVLEDETEVHAILKGFDNNMGLVLADAELWLPGSEKPHRKIGTTLVRGRSVAEVLSSDCALLAVNPFQ